MATPILVFVSMPLLLGGAILFGLLILTRIMPGVPKPAKATQAATEPAPTRGPEYVQQRATRSAAYRKGVLVFLGLVVLSIIEFVLASLGSTTAMFIMIVFKAALIMYYFMHIASVWRTEEAH